MKDYLNKNTDVLLEEFWDFSKETEKMIKNIYFPINIHLPIDIGEFAKKLGFDIVYENFLSDERNFGIVALPKTIYVNENISYKEQRWVIAKAVAIFLNGCNPGEGIFCIGNPFFISRDVDESYLDLMAMLLLLPITLFKQEVSKKIKSDDLLQHLSDIFQIPLFQLSIGYQFIKQMLCFQRQKEFEECNYDVELMPSDGYENIFL